MVYYLVRYLPPKGSGMGEIAFAVSTSALLTLEDLQTERPDQFVAPGFYSLMKATGETLTVEED